MSTDSYYHIYNRGNNGETLFKEEKNYEYFLGLYKKHISPIAETYAYCLLGNHFHLLVKIRPSEELRENLKTLKLKIKKEDTYLISHQFSKLFNAYSQGFNKAYSRTGSLFEKYFRRIEVKNESYFTQLVWYIHLNPQKHGFVEDFRDYPHSSYHAILSNKKTNLKRKEVVEWFGSIENVKTSHLNEMRMKNLQELILE